ncbi:MAG: DNA helicase [Candidatus Hydrogenedentota bacterium]
MISHVGNRSQWDDDPFKNTSTLACERWPCYNPGLSISQDPLRQCMSSHSHSILANLNPQQLDAVVSTEGPVLVLAGAGSGKTSVITRRIAHILSERLAAPEQILAVTFTNKAAEEMRERVAALVGKERAKRIALSTFHSFCVRVLREEIERLGYRKNFTISSESDTRTLVRRVLHDMDGIKETFSVSTFLEQISLVKSGVVDPDVLEREGTTKPEESETEAKYRTWLPAIYEQYQSALRAANTVDFDDLLLLTLRLFREHPEAAVHYQDRFKYVMVDEYQDTNRVQYDLTKTLVSKHRNLCVVGDDDQAIYSWRGASIRNILDYERDFPEAKVIRLEQNYRSTEIILSAANAVIANNKERRPKKLWSTLGRGRTIDHIVVGDEEDEARQLIAWMEYIRGKAGADYHDFAVLYRSNLQSRPFEIAFRQSNIPYAVYGGREFFDRAEVKDVVSYLKVISNPRDEPACLRVINVPRRGVGDATLQLIHDVCRQEGIGFTKAMQESIQRDVITPQAAPGLRQFVGLISTFRNRFRENNSKLSDLVTDLVHSVNYRDEIIRTSKSPEQAQSRWSNVEAVVNAVAAYEQSAAKPTLGGFLDQSSLANDDLGMTKQERRQQGVSLMTVHSAKGLEFPFVFIAGCEEGSIPHDKNSIGPQLEEERRLFYVALTRGKRHVTLFEALSRTRNGRTRMTKCSRFLSEIPEDLLNRRIHAACDMVQARVDPPKPKPGKRPPRRAKNRMG